MKTCKAGKERILLKSGKMRCTKIKGDCPAGKEYNADRTRCYKICASGKERNSKNRCVNRKLTHCPKGQQLNKARTKCVRKTVKKAADSKVAKAVEKKTKAPHVASKQDADLQMERKNAFKAVKKVEPFTEAEKLLLQHFNEYKHTSPKETAMVKLDNIKKYKIVNRGDTPLQHFLPSSVILLITMHGRTKEPFISPVNVSRRMGSDFGTCNFSFDNNIITNKGKKYFDKIKPSTLITTGFMPQRATGAGENLKKKLLHYLEEIREVAGSEFLKIKKYINSHPAGPAKNELLDKYHFDILSSYMESKHHTKVKTFKKGLPMFNKSLSMNGPNGHEMHGTHSIFVRADLPLQRLKNEDVLFEIHTERTTLEEVLNFLYDRGVTDVSLFDLSCSGDSKDPIHHKRYGGD